MSQQCRDEDESRYHGHSHNHGHGGHGHSHDGDDEHDAVDPSGSSLYQFIDKDKILCLNEARHGMAKNIIKTWDKRLTPLPRLESDVDAELLVTIPFTCAVSIKSFCINGCEKDRSPSKVKIFVNRDDLDFDSAKEIKPVQQFDLVEDFTATVEYPLVPAKFKSVSSITLFFPENFTNDEDEITMLSYMGFKGEGSEIRRGIVETTYEASAQLKDHTKVKGENKMGNYLE